MASTIVRAAPKVGVLLGAHFDDPAYNDVAWLCIGSVFSGQSKDHPARLAFAEKRATRGKCTSVAKLQALEL
jgi:hypothetical protein